MQQICYVEKLNVCDKFQTEMGCKIYVRVEESHTLTDSLSWAHIQIFVVLAVAFHLRRYIHKLCIVLLLVQNYLEPVQIVLDWSNLFWTHQKVWNWVQKVKFRSEKLCLSNPKCFKPVNLVGPKIFGQLQSSFRPSENQGARRINLSRA